MKKLKITVILLAITIGTFGIANYDFKSKSFEITKNLEIFYDLFSQVNTYYVDEIDPGKLIKKGIDAMLDELDPYTVYIPRSKIEDLQFMTTGEYGGVGAIISTLKDRVLVRQIYQGFPMDKAGIDPGDEILEINGKNVSDKNSEEISELVKGAPNSSVKFLIQKPEQKKPVKKEVVRAKIHVPDIPYSGMLNETTAYIKLKSFTRNSSNSVKKVFKKLQEKHDPEALIFDLRSNPGGLLNEAVKIMSLFVPQGQHIVSTKGRASKWDQSFNTTGDPLDTTINVAVLMNNKSASASEIIAGAMQDLDRGIIIGQRSYGKGLVQATVDVAYKGKLKITTAKYYIPSGRCIQAIDYASRREDGSLGAIPDSLISTFTTRNGRKVLDGGGIRPDVPIKKDELAQVTRSLISDDVIFDYITNYTLNHDSIDTPLNYKVSDMTYNRFKEYVYEQGFSYKTQSEKQFQKLQKIAKKEKYYGKARNTFNQMDSVLKHDVKKDLAIFRDEVEEILRQRIIGRYYYQEGEIKASLQTDEMAEKAITILKNEEKYNSILNPN